MVPSPSLSTKKMKSTTTPSPPLRRSERNRNVSSSNQKLPIRDSRIYRAILTQPKKKDCNKETDKKDKSTPDDSNTGEDKIDESSKEVSLHCKEVFEDCILPSEEGKAMDMRTESSSSGSAKEPSAKEATLGSAVVQSNSTTHETSDIPERVQSDCHEKETSQTLAIRDSDSNESLIRKCVGNEKGQNLTPSKRKSTVVDKHSDVSPRVVDDENCNLIVNPDPEKLCCNVVETSGPSKRIRGINNVDQHASKSNDEKSCTRSKEGKSGDSVEKPQGNTVENEKIRTLQRSLHRSLKPEIAKLCETLHLPDNVKSMAGKFLEYTMNNYKICTEPVSILQAFQLSLCWAAASLLSHKLDTEASLILAKQHLNFDCNKDAVDEINAMLWDLKDKFLLRTGSSGVNCSPKASESSNRVHSNTDVTSDVELTKKVISRISRNTKETQKRKDQWRELLHMQQENKLKLQRDFETEMADLGRRYKIEWVAIKSQALKKKKKNEMLSNFTSGFDEMKTEIKSKYDVRLRALETEHLEARQKFRESSQNELSNLVSSKELEAPLNAPKILLSDEVLETSCAQATASELSREAAVGLPSTVRSTVYPENAAPLSADQISDGGLDGVVSSRPCNSSSPSNGHPATISLLNSPSSTQQVSDRVLPTIADGQIPVIVPELIRDAAVGFPSTVRTTDYPENAAPLNSSSTDQISDGGLDGVVSSSPCIFSSPGDGRPATSSLLNPPSSKQQVPDSVLPAITDGQIPVTMPENSHEEAECELVDNMKVNESTTPDNQEVVQRTIAENTSSQETSVSRARDPIEPREQVQVQPLSSVESPLSLPENSHEEAECELIDNMEVNESTAPDNQEVLQRTIAENTLSQETSVSRAPDSIEPREQVQVQPLSSVESPLSLPENSHEEAECELIDNMEVNDSTTPDNQEVVQRTIAENTLSQETSVSRARDPIEPREQVQVQPLSSVESTLGPVHILPANLPNRVSMVMEPPEQVRLPSSGFLSSNRDFCHLPLATGGVDREGTNKDSLSRQFPEAMIEVQNQAVEQPTSNMEVDSHSRLVVPPVSNMVLDSLVPGGFGAHLTDTRNMSTHRVINNLPIQTPAQLASRNFRPYFHDPLNYELERLRKLTDQNRKNHEDMKLQLKCNFEKEVEELHRKYDIQMKEIEVEFQKTKKNYDTQSRTVYIHKILADTFTKANFDPMFSGASGMLQGILPYDAGFSQLLFQPSRQQNATQPPLVASSSVCRPPATTLQNSHASTSSHTMVPPPTQASYNTSGNISGFSARIPHTNSISSPSGNQQTGREIRSPLRRLLPRLPSTSVSASGISGDIRAPAPPLPPYRPSASIPASTHSGEIRAPAPHLPPYRPSTTVPPSTHSGEIRTPAPHLMYRPSTFVPPSTHSGEIRGPAPHLPPYRPSTSVPASSFSGVPLCIPNQPAPSNSSANSLSLTSQWLPRPMPAISQFGPHRGHGHENTGGFPSPNLSAGDMCMSSNSQSSINLPNTMPRMSDHSQFGTSSSMPANSAQEATPSDVVCISDDD